MYRDCNFHLFVFLKAKEGKDESQAEPQKNKPKSIVDSAPVKSKADSSPVKSKVDSKPVKSKVDSSLPKPLPNKAKAEKGVKQKASGKDATTADKKKEPVATATNPVVKTKTKAVTGARGNPHYMAELSRTAKTGSNIINNINSNRILYKELN